MAIGTEPTPQGVVNPTIDHLLEHTNGNKYALVVFAAKRARQLNSYWSQASEGIIQSVGPLVDANKEDKQLTVAFREIDEGVLEEHLAADDENEGR
ncbi:DNA-directed RNA polymerase subunit omega [Aeriscardovia aeriphila]|uniref:DNA-directed RNA polymerase subunit omega n=1 Tax=Aeriscardovia aeriphila TaxID=218139 RepID=A0A261FB86_9BIFI|nr:DNA-directed RNA polymerase subunit omega [Aeriscardovia aeriphila]MDO5694187.1 DNA-directed RNA polymerase subunit omega [Aeriscardovia aeriphila]NYI25556.1 DNA-directed RNA polymerase subunit omega [Aeriscardovia aeriphila]OZG56295.1 DNA-directed RNA polymerase subunit omega [Aeriscardovia aeriphila]HJF17618.1 DNA-directed RNA polymerase subunit omega [Aeriscardovia aeriphila]